VATPVFDIYSIGDGAFLATVINAVASITGSGDWAMLAKVGFAVGVILTLMQAVIQARPPQWQVLLVSLVIYGAMFGPTAKVAIEDIRTGRVRVVDNVPIGIAAVGGGVSGVGYGITRMFETAFGTPGGSIAENGYADPLTLLANVRKSALQEMANHPTSGADVRRSWINYIRDCTLYDVDQGSRSREDFVTTPGWGTYESTRRAITTKLFLGDDPVEQECRTAWNTLRSYTTGTFYPRLVRALAAGMTEPAATMASRVQDALDAVAGAGVDAREYMVMSATLPWLFEAEGEAFEEIRDFNGSLMVQQAVAQRNAQWTAEASLFVRFMRPVMVFFESLMFAISPLMVFAVGLGPMGLKMIGKYLVFGLWMQLWLPILAVTNLYTLMTARAKLDALQSSSLGDLDITSIAGMLQSDLVIQDYLGTAGMLVASTPFIAAMVLYGSAITATALAGRLQGGDHIDEKITSPDVTRPAAAHAMQPLMATTPLGGTTKFEAHQALPTFDRGMSADRIERSSEQELQQEQMQFRHSLANATQRSHAENYRTGDSGARAWSTSAQQSHVNQLIQGRAEKIAEEYGLDKETGGLVAQQYSKAVSRSVEGHLGADVTASLAKALQLGIPGGSALRALGRLGLGRGADSPIDVTGRLGGSGALRGEARDNSSDQVRAQQKLSEKLASSIVKDVNQQMRDGTELAESLEYDTRHGYDNQFTYGLSDTDEDRLGQDASELVQASRMHERAEAMQERWGVSTSYRADHVAHAITSRPDVMNQLRSTFDMRYGHLTGDMQRLWQQYTPLLGRENAEAFAMISLLTGHDQPQHTQMRMDERISAAEFGNRIIDEVMGGTTPSGIRPDHYAGVGADAPRSGSVQAMVDGAGLDSPRGDVAGLDGRVESGYRARREELRGQPEAVRQQNALNEAQLDRQAAGEARERLSEQRSDVAEQIMTASQHPRPIPEVWKREHPDPETVRGQGDGRLTDEQMAVYEAASQGDAEALAAARQRLTARHGEMGEYQADILQRAGESGTDGDLSLLRRYNQIDSSFEDAVLQEHDATERMERAQSALDSLEVGAVGTGRGQADFAAMELGDAGARGGSATTAGRLQAPAHLREHLDNLERQYGLPSGILTAVAWVESRFNPDAHSGAGAIGMFQIMPGTARDLGVADPRDPYQGAVGAAKHLARDYQRFGDWDLAVYAYNAGPGRVDDWVSGERGLPQETQDYLPKVADALARTRGTG